MERISFSGRLSDSGIEPLFWILERGTFDESFLGLGDELGH
jgi:hypothetical protein